MKPFPALVLILFAGTSPTPAILARHSVQEKKAEESKERDWKRFQGLVSERDKLLRQEGLYREGLSRYLLGEPPPPELLADFENNASRLVRVVEFIDQIHILRGFEVPAPPSPHRAATPSESSLFPMAEGTLLEMRRNAARVIALNLPKDPPLPHVGGR